MTPYDSVEYPAKPFLQCHPDRLAVMGKLFGLAPARVDSCRVLEIGCGDGLNLVAEALALFGADFTGIDLSRAAIERGQAMATAIGLTNVHLEQRDLRDLTEAAWDKFDFIVAHGIYSWIPEDARDALLAAIRRWLAPQGIAFVSYNAYPGAYLPRMIREMAQYSGRPMEWLETARTFTSGSALYRALAADETTNMLARDPGLLFHDDLAEVYFPVYFTRFMGHAAKHGLQYLSEAELGGGGMYGLPIDAAREVERWSEGSRMAREQYGDFLHGRRFRQTLLCHGELAVRETPDAGGLGECFAAGPITEADGEFVSSLGGRVRTEDPAAQSMLRSIAAAWPAYLPMRASAPLLELFAGRMIDIRTVAPPVADRIASRPEASPLARYQIERGAAVTSLHHFAAMIENSSMRALLLLLDGTRTRAALIRDLGRVFPSAAKPQVEHAVDTHLEELRTLGLLCR